MNTNWTRYFASLIFIGWMLMPSSIQPQEGGDKLVVHFRGAAVTLNHVSLKDEVLGKEVAASLEKIEGVTRTRILPASGMVEARFDAKKTTGEQVANAAKKVLEEKLAGKRIEARNLPSGHASSKILVKFLAGDRVQLTSERFYWISCGTRGVSDVKKVNGVRDAELNGPAATITVTYDPSRTDIKAIAEAAKASLDSDHSAAMRGSMAEIEYLTPIRQK